MYVKEGESRMGDLLVPLYKLTDQMYDKNQTWEIRRPLPPERHLLLKWVEEHFFELWRSECAVATAQIPANCLIAVEDGQILGFACYDVTALSFFGPTGVKESARGRGIGHALLIESLLALRNKGYAYAVIGSAGPVDFYKKVVGAIEIPGSDESIYRGMLR